MNKIFGREPAVFFALVSSILLAIIQFLDLHPDLSGALNAAVLAAAGVATAATVNAEKALPALVGLVQAVFAVFLAYGTPVPESTQTGILALLAAVAAFFVRQNVFAKVDSDLVSLFERVDEAYKVGYENGADEATATPSKLRFAEPEARETGAHGHTEVMSRFDDGGERNPQR